MTEDPTDVGRGRKDRKGKQGRVREHAELRPASCQDHTPPALCKGEAQPHLPPPGSRGESWR